MCDFAIFVWSAEVVIRQSFYFFCRLNSLVFLPIADWLTTAVAIGRKKPVFYCPYETSNGWQTFGFHVDSCVPMCLPCVLVRISLSIRLTHKRGLKNKAQLKSSVWSGGVGSVAWTDKSVRALIERLSASSAPNHCGHSSNMPRLIGTECETVITRFPCAPNSPTEMTPHGQTVRRCRSLAMSVAHRVHAPLMKPASVVRYREMPFDSIHWRFVFVRLVRFATEQIHAIISTFWQCGVVLWI